MAAAHATRRQSGPGPGNQVGDRGLRCRGRHHNLAGGNSQGYPGPQDHIPHDHDPITEMSTYDFIEKVHRRQFVSMIMFYICWAA